MQIEVITRTPTTPAHPTPLLFVHGAWHGAWCWDAFFLSYFAQQGYIVHAMSLRGHGKSAGGERFRWIAASEHVQDVAQVVASLGTQPILIGHSMGGFIIQKYLETHSAPAAVLLTPIPRHGIWQFTMRLLRHHPLGMLRMVALLDATQIIIPREKADYFLFSSKLPDDQRTRYLAQLEHESFRMALDTLLLNLPNAGKVRANGTPMLVVAAEHDRLFSVAEEQATAKAYSADITVIPDMSHQVFLEPEWQGVADQVIAWLRKQGV